MPPGRIGKFELLDELGRGGMGVVYRARDTRLDRVVALKLMQAKGTIDEESRHRFMRECRAVAALNHPRIATLYEADETGDGTLYFAAELVEGHTLAHHLKHDAADVRARSVDLGLQLADALAAAHAQGIIHRDIKPANLMITPQGQLKVLDFGLAYLGGDQESRDPDEPTQSLHRAAFTTTAGVVLGTPAYMSPEQISGESISAAADIFAAGVVLYELSTGVRPFEGVDLTRRLEQIRAREPAPASAVGQGVTPALSAVIARCLQPDAAARYQNGAELHAALAACARPRTTRRWTWAALGAAAVAIAAGAVWWNGGNALAFNSHDRLLLADVVNQTSESVFTGALGTALEADLRQSQYALIVGRREIAEALRLTRRQPDTPIDLATALELAKWVGAKAVLAPSIVQAGDTFQLDATLYATETQSPMDTVKVTAEGKDEVLKTAVDEFTSAVRSSLGESLAAIAATDAPVVVVTTSSWEALEAMRMASTALSEGRAAESASLLEEALKLDPEFAAARAQLGLVLMQFLQQPERGQRLLREGAATIDRLSAYERAMLKGLITQYVDRDLNTALSDFQAASRQFPERNEPYQNQGIVLRDLGRYAEAAAAFKEANRRFPSTVGPLLPLWWLYTGPLRDPIAAEATARALLELRDDAPEYLHMLAWTYVCQQRYADAATEMDAIVARFPEYSLARINGAHLSLRTGNPTRAAARYRSEIDDAIRTGKSAPAVWHIWAAIALAAAGSPDAKAVQNDAERAAVSELRSASPAGRPAAQAVLAQALALAGRRDAAQKALAALPPVEQLRPDALSDSAKAFAMLGNADEAIARLERVLRLSPFDAYYNLILPEFAGLWTDDRFTGVVSKKVRGA